LNPSSIEGLETALAWGRWKIINGEAQAYADPNWGPEKTPFRFGNDGLQIVCRQTPTILSDTNMPYTSGALTSRKSFLQQYGYFEILAKLPRAGGAFPAFWLLPFDWSALHAMFPDEHVLSEIDIMEAVKDVHRGIYYVHAHFRDGNKKLGKRGKAIKTGANLIDEYHRYGLEWNKDYLIFYFDRQEVFRVDTPSDMHDKRYWILNYATGSGWSGNPVAADYPDTFDVKDVLVYSGVDDRSATPIQEGPRPVILPPNPVPTTTVAPAPMTDGDETDPVVIRLTQSQLDRLIARLTQ